MHLSKKTTFFILGTIAIGCVMIPIALSCRSSPNEGRTYVLIGYIKSGLELYWINKGKLPDSNSASSLIQAFNNVSPYDYTEFIDNKGSAFIDGWGMPLVINLTNHNQFQFISFGPDKIGGTKDDITDYWSIPESKNTGL